MKFTELNLEPALQNNLDKLGFQDCTPVQELCIPLLLEGKDVSGLAQTGTGKTGAFLVPLIDRILKATVSTDGLTPEQIEASQALMKRRFHEWKAQNFILVLVPTRELAEQVGEICHKLIADTPLKSCVVYGGTSYDKQKEAFRNGAEFIIATPGRLIDLYKEHFVDLKQVRGIVFDEADRMFDMGFKDDMKFILSRMPRQRQFCVFSATLNFDVLNTAYQFGAEPIEINISKDQAKADNVKDEIFHVGNEDKPSYLLSILKKHNPKQTIVFSNFKFNVERIAKFLTINGMPAMGISSLLTQAQRNRVMEQFKAENDRNILVATDVAARGLDIKGVDMVVNFEMPNDPESYVHRIGRTGRAGAMGQAFSLVSDKDVDSLARVEEYLKNKLNAGWMEDAELMKDYKPFPREESRSYNDRSDNRDNRGEHRGPRQDHRGPRNDRGPRRGPDRGPRKDNRSPDQAARPQGQAGQGQRPNDRNRQGPPRDRQDHRNANGPARPHDRNAKPGQQNSQPNGQHRKPHQHRSHQGGKHPQHRHQQGAKAKPAAAKPVGIVKNVTSFFKKLFN